MHISSSSSATIISCVYLFMVGFITLSYAYVVYPSELRNGSPDQHFELSLPLSYDRAVRATKFPRIGRSPADIEEMLSFDDGSVNPAEVEDVHNDNDDRWLEQRSVLFPRIGKRAFHNLMWSNSYSNPHRMLDSQGRYQVNGYDYRLHSNQPSSLSHLRGKRNLHM